MHCGVCTFINGVMTLVGIACIFIVPGVAIAYLLNRWM